jgi:hypothetical protein
VARKRDCHRRYSERIGDEWADLIEDIYMRCRGEWNYLIPDAAEDRAILRAICERTLAFENHFLGVYRDYLLGELADAEAEHLPKLLGLLEQITFRDDVVEAALHALQLRGSGEIREIAGRALARM